MSRRLQQLAPHHHLDAFDSGTPPLVEWLKRYARNAAGQGTRTYATPNGSS